MMNDKMNDLGRMIPPVASPEARARALSLAMQAFDEAENTSATTQGTDRHRRQSSIINRLWSPVMNRKFLAGSALATLLVVPAAAFLTLQLTRDGLPVDTTGQQIEVAGKDALKDAKTKELLSAKPDVSAEKPLLPDASGRMAADADAQSSVDAVVSESEVDTLGKKAEAGEAADADAAMPGIVAEGAAGIARNRQAAPSPVVGAEALVGGTVMRTMPSTMPGDIVIPQEENRDRFTSADTNPVKSVATDPVSTFSADVDTASYSFVRKSLMAGQMPDPDSVRVEEMINYFPYNWPGPDSKDEPFKATVTVLPTPWNAGTRLMHVGIKGYDVAATTAPRANLVFLIDVSGSMDEPDKLPLLKGAFRLLVEKLKPEDTVSIVTYAGNAGTVLEPTAIKDKAKILAAIDTLQPGGSTAGAQGLEAAYDLAERAFVKGGVNRIMLATDGDFNVGPSSDDELKTMIETKRKSGIFLSVLGFGRGNYNDALMQTLAQNGNGTATYIDTMAEAQKSLVEEAGSSLFPIAKDVKFQVEFNPQQVAEYRLIGYETRALKREDFNNDKVDAGDIGSGHRVTAIYEITPKGSPAVLNDDLRYGTAPVAQQAEPAEKSGELGFLKIRYKKPDSNTSNLITTPVTEANAVPTLQQAGQDIRFSLAVAAFGQKLRGTDAVSAYAYGSILDLAAGARGEDPYGYRGEFLNLVRLARSLGGE
ncbi:VWA domain-containing protein [Pararhizobium sp. BT-229]|uniref:vWA domain-containing protein n=1 Tax=Pararhizobium sp. BT-229 TaxID=2986923 RepID=UPI0021F79507|nr:VWA domain-containing protein [Pararhizobium sp. BT-229]MCV9960859.1 VWA domain-containing protein [Pararhizobium sp. BT-229]